MSSPSCASGPAELDLDHRALLGVDVELGDRARVDAGDPHLRALDDAEGVVQLDLVGVRVVGAGGRASQPTAAPSGEQGVAMSASRLMGPGGTWVGSQSSGRRR